MEFENSIWRHYHESSKDKAKGHPPIPFDSNKWPEAWKTILYKEYPRLPQIALGTPLPLTVPLEKVLDDRSSFRSFTPNPLGLEKLGSILYWSLGHRSTEKKERRYPSGGGLFPIETYIYNLVDSEEWSSGVYHYHVHNHALELLWKHRFERVELDAMFGYPWAKNASVLVVFTAVFERTIQKYGERGYRFILLEAGHMAQNIALSSAGLQVSCCSLGGMNDGVVESFLDLKTDDESAVYALVLGV